MEEVIEFLGRAITAVAFAAVLIGLVCLVGLIVAGTYGILHPGNDFGFGGRSDVGSDSIVLPGVVR